MGAARIAPAILSFCSAARLNMVIRGAGCANVRSSLPASISVCSLTFSNCSSENSWNFPGVVCRRGEVRCAGEVR